MTRDPRLALRVRAARAIASRELRELLRTPDLYVALGVALTAASLAVRSVLAEVAQEGLVARASPLYLPLFVATVVLAFSAATTSAVSIARERESGTLEVLFYGPVDAASYVVGKYVAQLLAYLALCAPLAISLATYGWVTNLGFSADLLTGIALSVLAAACTIAFGLLLSSVCGSIRDAILLLVGVGLLLLGVQGGSWLLAGLPQREGALGVAAETLAAADRVVTLVSPYSYLDRGLQAALLGDAAAYAIAFASPLIYAALLLGGAIWSVEWRGVRRNEE
ncbi:MAG TPA: ABC transporter permease [Chloroflexota bacterium]|nr:ABC transporter permease [Chloroflexota bacterium]